MKRAAPAPVLAPAAPPAFVLSCVDAPRAGETLQPGALLAGKGWAISEAGIESIALYLGDSFLCYATYGQPRPEIGRDFGHYPQAHHSGFVFSVRLGADIERQRGADLEFRFRAGGGSETRRLVRLSWPKPAHEALQEATHQSSRPWPIRVVLEECRIDGAGRLRLAGHAMARDGVPDLALFLGEHRLAEPERGLSRPDVAAQHPGYAEAALSGFRLVEQLPAAPGEQDTVRVVARLADLQRQIVVPLALPDEGPRLMQSGEVTLCCDLLRLHEGALVLGGWAIGAAETREIELLAGGVSLGFAETGLKRPDIGNRFPALPAARFSGFRFRAALSPTVALEAGDRIDLRVADQAGGERRMELRLPGRAPGIEADADQIHAGIEAPALGADRAAEPIRGIVTIAGWAVSLSGIRRVTIWSDDRLLGEAHLGGRREEIGANFPDLPDSLTSGFALSVQHRKVGDGDHAIRVAIEARSGAVTERAFRITLTGDDDARLFPLRRAVPAGETALRLDLLKCHGALPDFTLVIRPSPSGSLRGLERTLQSLRRQSLERWQALLVVEDDQAEEARAILGAAGPPFDRRAAIVDADQPHPLFTGAGKERFDLLCLLRAGDRLGADALMELAVEARLGRADFVYADERCFDPGRDGVYPFLKPGWSPDLLLSMNYLGRAWCARRALVRRAGLELADIVRHGMYHAALRLTEQARHVAHVPSCLMERAGRRVESLKREQTALDLALARRRIEGTIATGRTTATFRLQRALPRRPPVSVIIATCGARGLIRTAIEGLRTRTDWPALEIICLDDIPAEDAELKSWLAGAADRVIPIDFPFNWSRANNLGAAAATGEYLLFLNDDTEPAAPGWLAAMMEQATRREVGAVGPQLLYPDGKVQHAGMFLAGGDGLHIFRFAEAEEPGPFGLALAQREVTAVTGACLLTRRALFRKLGGFDEGHGVIKNDLDFCLRVGASGHSVVYTPHATLTHHEMASRAHLPDAFDAASFQGAWGLVQLRGDPLFNPNLRPYNEDMLPQSEPVQYLQTGQPLLDKQRVRRILAVKLDHIGDFLCALPALKRLRTAFPRARITLLAGGSAMPLATSCGLVDEVLRFDFFHPRAADGRRTIDEAEYATLAERLRAMHFDLAVDLRTHADTRHVLRHAGATWLAGFDRGARFPWLDIAVEWEGDPRLADKRQHVSDLLLRLADAVANAAASPAAHLAGNLLPSLGKETRKAASHLRTVLQAAGLPAAFGKQGVVAIHPGAGVPLKQWPAAEFAGLIRLLLADRALGILLVGGVEDGPVAHEIASLVDRPEAVHILAGRLPLDELALLLNGCVLFVGNDSGPKHLAGALGVPTVGIHADHVDATEWGPLGPRAIAVRRHMRCGPCYISDEADCPRNVSCLRGIRPSQVWRACRLLLGLSPVRGDG